jgi:ABC-type iron transport system FetAB ATPase subunit
MARPTIDKTDKRAVKFTFRMNEREEKYLIKLMAYANLSGAEVIREIVFKNRLLQPKIPVLDQKTYGELKRIGTNINQIAKKLNSDTKVSNIEITLELLSSKLDFIIQNILDDR